jgi:type II secretory pathway pseudopilin PulG
VLLETIAAVFVFGLVGTAVLTGLSTSAITGQTIDVQANVENIARNQMERMFTLPYQGPGASYPTINVPEGYVLTCVAEEFNAGNPNIERVAVTVTVNGTVRLEISTLRTR